MKVSRSFVCFSTTTCLLVASLPAQNTRSGTIQELLPQAATIIETASLNLDPGKALTLVLWMEHPERVVQRDAGFDCVNQVYGDHWIGPTGLSLVDLRNATLVNTVEIRPSYEQPNDKDPSCFSDSFLGVKLLLSCFLSPIPKGRQAHDPESAGPNRRRNPWPTRGF